MLELGRHWVRSFKHPYERGHEIGGSPRTSIVAGETSLRGFGKGSEQCVESFNNDERQQ